VFEGADAAAVHAAVELGVRAALEAVEAEPAEFRVRVVDAIARSGGGAKQKLVVSGGD